jgi:hypothetical protein
LQTQILRFSKMDCVPPASHKAGSPDAQCEPPSNFAWLFAGATLTACNPEGSHNLVIAIEGVWLRVRSVRLHLSLVEQGRRAVIAIDIFLDPSDGFVL